MGNKFTIGKKYYTVLTLITRIVIVFNNKIKIRKLYFDSGHNKTVQHKL